MTDYDITNEIARSLASAKPANKNEKRVWYTAGEVVGGYENAVWDGIDEDGEFTAKEIFEDAYATVISECPREVRFLGEPMIVLMVISQVGSFECKFKGEI